MNNFTSSAHELRVRPGAQRRAEDPGRIEFRSVVATAWRRAGLGLGVGVALIALVLAYAATRPPLFTAYGQLLVDPRQANLTAIQPSQPDGKVEVNLLDTDVETIGSRAAAEDLVRRYALDRDPEFNPAARASDRKPDALAFERIVQRVRDRITVDRDTKAPLISVGFSSRSPLKAARLANGLLQVFLDQKVKAKVATFEHADEGVRSGLETMRRQVEAAEQNLAEYKNAHGLYGTDDTIAAEQEASLLSQEVAKAQADAAERRASLDAALRQAGPGGSLDNVGASTTSPAMYVLRKKEAEVSIRLAQLEADFKPEYPEVKRAQAQLNDTRAAIQQETRRVLSSLRAEAQAANGRVSSLAASRGAIEGALAARDRAEPDLFSLEQKATSAKELYAAYLKRIGEIAAGRDMPQTDARIVAVADPPHSPSSPNMLDMSLFALVLGALGAAAAMIVAEVWDRTLRSRADVERELAMQVAGVLPELASVRAAARGRSQPPEDYLVREPFSSFAESFRHLHAFVALRPGPSGGGRIIAFTSAIPGEGKSLSCCCLGRAMALSGKRVVVVDCDLRRRGLTRRLGEADRGVVQVADGSVPLAEALRLDAASGLWVLPASPNAVPEDLFAHPETERLFERLREDFDYVLLDTPPVLGVADARVVAGKADQVLLGVRWDRTPLRAAQAAAQILYESGAPIVGAVLTRVDARGYAGFSSAGQTPYGQARRRPVGVAVLQGG